MKISKLKKITNQRFRTHQLALKNFNRELVQNFNRRASYSGIDRKIGDWRIIDVHDIPQKMNEKAEVDFWCCDGKSLYLLRIRNREDRKIDFIPSNLKTKSPSYIVVKMPIENPPLEIKDEFLKDILHQVKILRNFPFGQRERAKAL